MSLTRFSRSVRSMIYCAALLAFSASILVIISKNGGSRSVSAQDGPVVEAPTAVFTNPAAITIPSSGNGAPYPSAITVAGLSGNISTTPGSVKVTINSFSHAFPSDVIIALVGPGGQAFMIQGRGGLDDPIGPVTYTLSDTGSDFLPDPIWGPGTYKPTNWADLTTSFPAPGPGTSYADPGNPEEPGPATFSSVYGNTAPNGTWNLFVRDPFTGDAGQIAGGWSLEITTTGGSPSPTPLDAMADFDADGKTDPAIIRVGAGASSPAVWWIKPSGLPAFVGVQWGQASDTFIPADFDGDLKDDVAVWRPGAQGVFYIIRSTNSTVRVDEWGTNGDDPTVVGDYNGDNIDDVAVYRPGTTFNGPSFWYWRPEGGAFTGFQWGSGSDFPAPGDYDGDNRMDYAVQRPNGAVSDFWIWRSESGTFTGTTFGTSTDLVVPGDYDNDRKTDIAVLGSHGNPAIWVWSFRPSAGGPDVSAEWGWVDQDIPAPGDYDGNGTADFAVWRFGPQSIFYAISPNSSNFVYSEWGTTTDEPVTKSYVH